MNPRLYHAKRDRRRRLENENVDEKMRRRAKNRESRRRQRQSGAAENRAAGLTARRCDVGLTLRHRRRRMGREGSGDCGIRVVIEESGVS